MKAWATWMGLALAGWGAFGWAVWHRGESSTRIPGAGDQFQATTVSTNGGKYTAISRTANGETVWGEWKVAGANGNPDAVYLYHKGHGIAAVMKLPGEAVASCEFTFFGADGRPRERWLAQSEHSTWDEQIKFSDQRSVSERLARIDGKWQPVVIRDSQRRMATKGGWAQLAYTNGTWSPLPGKEW